MRNYPHRHRTVSLHARRLLPRLVPPPHLLAVASKLYPEVRMFSVTKGANLILSGISTLITIVQYKNQDCTEKQLRLLNYGEFWIDYYQVKSFFYRGGGGEGRKKKQRRNWESYTDQLWIWLWFAAAVWDWGFLFLFLLFFGCPCHNFEYSRKFIDHAE